MDLRFLIRGMIFGLSVAAPVGPMGVLCIRRTLADGRIAGLVTGLGTATADACYGAVAAFGLTFVSSFLVNQQFWLRLIGGAFLCYLGATTFLSRPAERPAIVRASGLRSAYFTTFALTLTNPLTILTFAAIFAGIGAGEMHGAYGSAALLVLGVFLGSALWWLLLSSGTGLVRTKLTPARLVWVNRISGGVIATFGVLALVSIV
ncbi:MAG TPA: LysE family transporter [Thermomicrobiales bacterium]|jgi:threonine/homoserine/homoserine lactone efflux protein